MLMSNSRYYCIHGINVTFNRKTMVCLVADIFVE